MATARITEILQQLKLDGVTWEANEVAEFIAKLVTSRLASTLGTPAKTSPAASNSPPQAQAKTWSQRLPAVLSLMISQRIPLLNGHAIASKLEKRIGVVFSSIGMVYWCGFVISGLMIVAAYHEDFADELRRMFDPGLWLMLVGVWAVAKVIHETGHAVAARYHDVHVGKIGIMFFFLAPLAYVDVTDAWKLKSRWSRVQIALAGVYLELAVAAMAAWAWWLLPDGYAKHLAAQCFLIAGPTTLLVNANPLLRLDGYYVVSDLTEIPNLRMHGRRQLAGLLEKLLLKIDPPRALLSGLATKICNAPCCLQRRVSSRLDGRFDHRRINVGTWSRDSCLLWPRCCCGRSFRCLDGPSKVWKSEPPERWFLNDKRKRLLCHASLLLLVAQYLCVSHSPLIAPRSHRRQIPR